MATHYEILGVEPHAPHDELRRAYHRQARRHHPDARPDADQADAERARRRMARINAAWNILGDAGRRRDYDTQIGVAVRPPSGRGGPGGGPATWQPLDTDEDVDLLGDDVEESRVRGPADLLVFVPVSLFVLAVATFAFSVLSQSPTLMWASIILLPIAALAFVTTPLLVLFTRSRARSQS